MSPTVLAMLADVQRKMNRDAAAEWHYLRSYGYSVAVTRRSLESEGFTDAVKALRWDLRLTGGRNGYYSASALATVGIARHAASFYR